MVVSSVPRRNVQMKQEGTETLAKTQSNAGYPIVGAGAKSVRISKLAKSPNERTSVIAQFAPRSTALTVNK